MHRQCQSDRVIIVKSHSVKVKIIQSSEKSFSKEMLSVKRIIDNANLFIYSYITNNL